MEDIKIEDLWTAVNAKAQRQKAEKTELQKYRQDWERLKSLLPAPGEIPTPGELMRDISKIRKILERGLL